MEEDRPLYTRLTDLASESVGSAMLFVTDQWFAEASNLLKSEEPVWKEGLFTKQGKWMDGWESRRKRTKDHDWCLIKLGKPGRIHGLLLDTAFFTGNYVPVISVTGARIERSVEELKGPRRIGTHATEDDIDAAERRLAEEKWFTILQPSPLRPGYPETRRNYFESASGEIITHLRLNYFPDGGVARFKAFGEIPPNISEGDFAFFANGGVALATSNEHYGTPSNLFLPGRGFNMGNGWETARHQNRTGTITVDPRTNMLDFGGGKDWFVLRLGKRCTVDKVLVDTHHFKGNYPESILIEGIDDVALFKLPVLEQIRKMNEERIRDSLPWKSLTPIMSRTKLGPDKLHTFTQIAHDRAVTHLLITIFPDGGVSRLRILGRAKL